MPARGSCSMRRHAHEAQKPRACARCAGVVHGEHRLLVNHPCALLVHASIAMGLPCSCTSRDVEGLSDTLVSSA